MNRYHHQSGVGALVAGAFLCAAPAVHAQEENDQLTINSATLSSGGQQLGAASERGRMAEIFKLQKELVYQVLRQAGIEPEKLPPATKAAIDRPQTTNLQAFLAFSRGLDLLDQNRFAEALATFQQAVSLDPKFEMARSFRDATPRIQQDPGQIAQASVEQAQTESTEVTPLSTPKEEAGETVKPPEAVQEAPIPIPPFPPDSTAEKVSDQQGEKQQQAVIPPLCIDGTCLGFYSTYLEKSGSVSTGPYINFREEVLLQKGTTITIPQQLSGCAGGAAGGVCSTGFIKATVDNAGHLEQVTAFADDSAGGGISVTKNDFLDVRLDRNVNAAFAALEVGHYISSQSWIDATQQFTYDFFSRRAWFAEGMATSAQDLADLKSAQIVAAYQGSAFADILVNGTLSSCQSTGCGTFSTTVDFGKGTARDFQLNVDTGSAAANIRSVNEVTLGNGGRFFFNVPDATYQLGPPGNLQPVLGGAVGGTFGPKAGSVGGTFIMQSTTQGNGNFAAGSFGGTRK